MENALPEKDNMSIKSVETVIPIATPPPPYIMKPYREKKQRSCSNANIWLLVTNVITIVLLLGLMMYIVHHRNNFGWWQQDPQGGNTNSGNPTIIILDSQAPQQQPPPPPPPMMPFFPPPPMMIEPTATQTAPTPDNVVMIVEPFGGQSTPDASSTGASSTAASSTGQSTAGATGPTGSVDIEMIIMPIVFGNDSSDVVPIGASTTDSASTAIDGSTPAQTTDSGTGSTAAAQSTTAATTPGATDSTAAEGSGSPPAIMPLDSLFPFETINGPGPVIPPTSAVATSTSASLSCDGMQCGCYNDTCWTWATQDPNSNWFCFTQSIQQILDSGAQMTYAKCQSDADCTQKMICADCMIYDEIDNQKPRQVC